jgi:septal ring factor EnvC (AmiA/AmiB activator)
MPPRLRHLSLLTLLVWCALATGASPVAGAPRDLEGQRAAAERLRASVEAESRRIAETRAGVAQAEEQLAALEARVRRRQAQLDDAQDQLVRLRVRLTRLERREAKAERLLANNLVASYKSDRPNIVTVVLESHGFADLLERVEFFERVSRQNAGIVDTTRDAHAAVMRQSAEVERLRRRYSALAKAAIEDRDRAAVLRSALLRRQEAQLAERRSKSNRLAAVRTRIDRIARQQAAAVRSAEAATTATSAAPTVPTGNLSSKGADGVVAKVVAGANEIASTPYQYGGGHGGGSSGYDCSGSVSYALAAGGLISRPLDSSGFMGWGESGAGRRITVYANPGHAFMVVDGRRFDTSALSGGGTRWTTESRSTAGYVARHPSGL